MKQRQSSVALFERGRRHHDARVTSRIGPSDDAVLLLRGSIVRSASQSVRALFGWEPELCVGRSLTELLGSDTYELLDELQTAAEEAGGHFATLHALPLENVDGERIYVDTTIADRRDDSEVNGTLVTLHNVTERVRLEETIRQDDRHDPLTMIPNKRMFELLLAHSLSSREPVGVLVANVSHPDEIATDEAVIRMARRLETNLRAGDHVGRLGEGTFGLVIHRLDSDHPEADMAEVAQRITTSLHSIRSYVEIGISDSHGRNVSALQLIAEAQRNTVEA
jgi:PAS domain S-box-containing protein